MISFQEPSWLILLCLIVFIYWLHRLAPRSTTFYTSSLFLWVKSPSPIEESGLSGKVDLRWLLRALISLLLIITLAEPVFQRSKGLIFEVWIDDSLSMYTQQGEFKRMQIVMRQLEIFLKQYDISSLQLHSLADHAISLTLEAADKANWYSKLADWTRQPRGEVSLPPSNSLSLNNNHILVTDGADKQLNTWAKSAPLMHIIRTGKAANNIALSKFSLRKTITESERIQGMAQIFNLSTIRQKIRLFIEDRKKTINTQLIDIPANSNSIIEFSIPDQQYDLLQARIEATGDALALDNSLQLKKLWPVVNYQIQSSCNSNLQAVLDSSPLLIKSDKQLDLNIICNPQQPYETAIPALISYPATSTLLTRQQAHWHIEKLDWLHLAKGLAYSDKAPLTGSEVHHLLSADGRVLISESHSVSHSIHSYLDLQDNNLVQQAEYPLLIFELITRLIPYISEFTPVSANRSIDASQLTPLAVPVVSRPVNNSQLNLTSLSPFILLAALLLLMLDATLSYSQFRTAGKQNL